MKKSTKLGLIITLSLILTAGLALLFFSFLSPTASDREQPDGVRLYEAAGQAISQADNLSYRITEIRSFTTGPETHTEHSVKTAHTERTGVRHYTEQLLTYGLHEISVTELYTDGTMYVTVNGGRFSSEISAEHFLARTPPVHLLTPSLYTTVEAQETDEGFLIRFSDGSAFEPWFSSDKATLLHAYGAAILNRDGSLRACTYELSYRADGIVYQHYYRAENIAFNTAQIPLPGEENSYTPLENPDAILALEQASGYLLSAPSADTTYNERIYCQVFGDVREQTTRLRTNAATSWSARMETSVTVRNEAQTTAPITLVQTEIFQDGSYLISKDNASAVADPSVTQATMQDHCQDILVGTIPLPHHVVSSSMTRNSNVTHAQYVLSEDFSASLSREACLSLYGDPDILTPYEDSYATDYAICELLLDSQTGRPISSSLLYHGTYTIDGVAYALEYSAEQTYTQKEAGQ